MEKASRKLEALLALWNERRGTRLMPARSNLHVQVLKPWIGNLALIDMQADGGSAFRLCGTNLHTRFGGEMTRRDLADLPAEIGETLRQAITQIRHTRAPAELRHTRIIDGEPAMFCECAFRCRTIPSLSIPFSSPVTR